MNVYHFRGNIDVQDQGNIAPVGGNIDFITTGNLNIGNITATNLYVGNLTLPNISNPLIPNGGNITPYRYQRQSGTATTTITAIPPVSSNIIGYFGVIFNSGSLQFYPMAQGTTTGISNISINNLGQLLIQGTFVAEPYDLTILVSP